MVPESNVDSSSAVLLFFSLRMKSQSVTIQMKATTEYSVVVPFVMSYRVVLTFKSVDEIPKCDHSNESYY